MCLQKFVVYTFTNKESFDRVINIIKKDYVKYLPRVGIVLIKSYREWGISEVKDNRNNLTYEELEDYTSDFYPPFKEWDDLYSDTWEELQRIIKRLENENDFYGKITIEIL